MSNAELAWLAGLLEGEGYFLMYPSQNRGIRYRYPQIVVRMTDRDIIERAASLLGGNGIYLIPPEKRGRSKKQQFRAAVSGWKAADLMRELRPWMGKRRRAKIDEILTEYDAQEPTQARRRRACSEAAVRRPRRADGTFEPAS